MSVRFDNGPIGVASVTPHRDRVNWHNCRTKAHAPHLHRQYTVGVDSDENPRSSDGDREETWEYPRTDWDVVFKGTKNLKCIVGQNIERPPIVIETGDR